MYRILMCLLGIVFFSMIEVARTYGIGVVQREAYIEMPMIALVAVLAFGLSNVVVRVSKFDHDGHTEALPVFLTVLSLAASKYAATLLAVPLWVLLIGTTTLGALAYGLFRDNILTQGVYIIFTGGNAFAFAVLTTGFHYIYLGDHVAGGSIMLFLVVVFGILAYAMWCLIYEQEGWANREICGGEEW